MGLNYYSSKSETYNSASKMYGVNLSPYLRKYTQLLDRLMLHGTGYVLAGKNKYITDPGDNQHENHETVLEAGIYPGLTYFVTDRFGINTNFGSLAYKRITTKPENGMGKNVEKDFRANLSLSTITFGLSYFISR